MKKHMQWISLLDIYHWFESHKKSYYPKYDTVQSKTLHAQIAVQTINTDTKIVSESQLPWILQVLHFTKMAQTLYPHEVFIHSPSIRYRKPNV